MTKRPILVLAAMAATALVGPAAPALATPAPAPATVDVAAVAARLDALTVRISGNREQWQASELLNYHRVEGGVARCMKAAGKPFKPVPFGSRFDELTDADLGFGTGRGSVLDSVTGGARSLIRSELAAARLARTGALDSWGTFRPADVATLNRCTEPYQHRPYLDVDPPAGVYELSGLPGLPPVFRDPAVVAAMRPYRSCMKQRYGYDVDERTDFLYRPRLDYRDAPLPGHPAKPAWTRGVAAVKAAFAADTACRLPAYRIAIGLIAPHLDAWERSHRTQIDALQAAWQRRVTAARYLPHTLPRAGR